MIASSAPTLLPDPVAPWRSALEAIPADKPPCRYLTPARWAEMREAALDFCDRFGAEAHRLGWTASELFGVHPQHGTLRVEMCGALMASPLKAQGVEPDRVRSCPLAWCSFGGATTITGRAGTIRLPGSAG